MDTLLMTFFALLPVLGGGGALYLGVRFVRAFERRGVDRGEIQALREHLARLEEELGRASSDVERIEEAQRFTQRLLSERVGSLPTG